MDTLDTTVDVALSSRNGVFLFVCDVSRVDV